MIPETLLFQMKIGFPESLFFFGVVLLLGVISLWYIQVVHRSKNRRTRIPDIHDKLFEFLFARYIREELSLQYMTKNTMSHTICELIQYIKIDPKLETLILLEKSLYSGCPLSSDERKSLLESYKK